MATRRRRLSKQDADQAEKYFADEVFEENAGNTLGVGTRWQKGQRSPNPMGRPKVPDDMDELLTYTLGKNGKIALAKKLIEIALTGNLDAIKYIYDRAKGRPRQAVVNMTSEEDPLVRILNGLRDDNRALEGRTVPALPAGTRPQTQIREDSR